MHWFGLIVALLSNVGVYKDWFAFHVARKRKKKLTTLLIVEKFQL